MRSIWKTGIVLVLVAAGAAAFERGKTREEVSVLPDETTRTKKDPKDEARNRERSVQVHIKNLSDPDHVVRQNSAWMLGVLGAADAIEPLIEALKDRHISVQVAAHGALNRITGKNFGYKAYDEWKKWYLSHKDEIRDRKKLGVSDMSKEAAKASNTAGLGFLKIKRYIEAHRLFLDAVDKDPEVPDYRNNLGLAMMEMGRPIDALTYFEEAMGLDDSLPQPYMNVGQCFARLNRSIEAQHWYRKALERDKPGSLWEPCWTLGKEYLQKGDYRTALEFLEQARSKATAKNIRPFPIHVYRDLALAFYGLDMYHSAFREIRNLNVLGYDVNPEFERKVRDALKAQGVDPDQEDEAARKEMRARLEKEAGLFKHTITPPVPGPGSD